MSLRTQLLRARMVIGVSSIVMVASNVFAQTSWKPTTEPHRDETKKPDIKVEAPKRAEDPDLANAPLPDLIDRAIDVTQRRIFSTDVHFPWQIAHGVLALRHDYYLKNEQGKLVKALDWIASGPGFRGKPWFVKTKHGGKGHPFTEPWHFEGHPNQFLALFTLSRLPAEFTFKADKGTFTVADWIHNAQMECNDEEEMTWTLWALAFYLPPTAEWRNEKGEIWSMERLIKKQMKSPVNKSACGGTHGLFAIASARNAYVQVNGRLHGTWLEAHMHLQKHVEMAKSMQNPDGSFSSSWFRSATHTEKIDRRVSTTGHILEVLLVTLPQADIEKPWVQNAARRIAIDLITSANRELEPGGMYHALDSLVIFRDRMWPNRAKEAKKRIADKPRGQRLRF